MKVLLNSFHLNGHTLVQHNIRTFLTLPFLTLPLETFYTYHSVLTVWQSEGLDKSQTFLYFQWQKNVTALLGYGFVRQNLMDALTVSVNINVSYFSYHMKVLLNSFHLNGHTLGFHSKT